MTNKLFRYNTATQRLEEQARMSQFRTRPGAGSAHANFLQRKYNEHLSSLTSYAVSNPKEWEEGRDYTEGEFEVVSHQTMCGTISFARKPDPPPETVAIEFAEWMQSYSGYDVITKDGVDTYKWILCGTEHYKEPTIYTTLELYTLFQQQKNK